MMDLMYQIPSDDTITKCVVTKESILGEAEPELTHREEPVGRKKRRIGMMEETA